MFEVRQLVCSVLFCQYRDEENCKHQCPKCTRSYDTYDGLKCHLRRDHEQRDMIMNYAMSAGVIDETDKSLLEQLSISHSTALPEGLRAPLETLASVRGHLGLVHSQTSPSSQDDYDLKSGCSPQLESKPLSSLKVPQDRRRTLQTLRRMIQTPLAPSRLLNCCTCNTNRLRTDFRVVWLRSPSLGFLPRVPLQDLPLNKLTENVAVVEKGRRSKRQRNPIRLSPYQLEEQTYQLQMKKAWVLD